MNFEKFLKEHLSWEDYENLNEALGESQKATTMLINDPGRGNIAQLYKITELVQKRHPEINSNTIVTRFQFGIERSADVNC